MPPCPSRTGWPSGACGPPSTRLDFGYPSADLIHAAAQQGNHLISDRRAW